MSFLDIIDELIEDLNKEYRKVNNARNDKKYHIDFITERINSSIGDNSKLYPEDPIKSLGITLESVPDMISASFENLNRIESNIKASFNAYSRVREEYVNHADKEIKKESEIKKPDDIDTSSTKKPKESKIRKIGERPTHKLKERGKNKNKKSKESKS